MAHGIDLEVLAPKLEEGIATVGSLSSIYAPEYRLRTPVCGLASTAIHYYLRDRGIESDLVISTPSFSFDEDFQHVFLELPEAEQAEPTVIDATFGQFMSYAGLTPSYVKRRGLQDFPSEKIISFCRTDSMIVADWLATICKQFRHRYKPIACALFDSWNAAWDVPTLANIGHAQIKNEFVKIWDPSYSEPFTPSPDLNEASIKLADLL